MEHISLTDKQMRDNRGAAVIGLCLGLSLVFIFIIFFVFDMNRLQMAQRQLTAIADAAALSGTAMLTSKDTSFEDSGLAALNTTQLAAMQYAKNMVAMGNILGYQCYDPALGNAQGANPVKINWVANAGALSNPAPNTVNGLVQLVSPISNYIVRAPGDSSARALYVQLNYGYKPFLSMLGVVSVNLPAASTSSLQKLYVIMVFDCSGSMDDNTVVSFVYRRWTDSTDGAANALNGGKGQYVYKVVGTPGNGQLWQYAGLDYGAQPNGTTVNVLPPQNLDYLGFIFANQYTSYGGSSTNFDNAHPPLAFDVSIADYVAWPAGSPLVSAAYNAHYSSYPTNVVGAGAFQGPYYDNYFGTPPGNCRVKYGFAQGGSSYGGQVVPDISNPLKNLNTVSYANPSQLPGPGNSPAYYYYPTGYNPSSPPSFGNDGNLYFYDPYSMPMQNTNANYTAFTDLVANITAIVPPPTQPVYGPTTFAGFAQSFPPASSTYTIPIAETTSLSLTQSDSYEDDGTLNTIGRYPFPTIAYVVEASRGNLDDEWSAAGSYVANTPTNYDNALLGYGSNLGIIPRSAVLPGYQKAYQRLAMYVSQPYATAVDGAFRFFQNLCQTSCCSFGFVGFSVAPAVAVNYKCAYLGTWAAGDTSLAVAAPANTVKPTSVYSSWVYQPAANCNPNFWVSDCFTSPTSNGTILPAGPAGNPTGEAYDAGLNNTGPTRTTWLKVDGTATTPSNTNTLWANNNPGFIIPRSPLDAGTVRTQGQSYYAVAGSDWQGYTYTNAGTTADFGNNGLFKARPLDETAGLEAMQYALYNLTSSASLNSLSGGSTAGLTVPTATTEYGSKKAIVMFTDGVPTDDIGPGYSQYISKVVGPAQNAGIPIYTIGLALNSSLQTEQSAFLTALANLGACGSQQFQVTSAASLDATFTGIARQLAQGQR